MTDQEIAALTRQLFSGDDGQVAVREPSMTHEQITALNHLILPGDADRAQQLRFSLAELKHLQGAVIDRIRHEDEERNTATLPYLLLAEKLECFIVGTVDAERPRAYEGE